FLRGGGPGLRVLLALPRADRAPGRRPRGPGEESLNQPSKGDRMSDSPLEELEHHEHAEHAEHAAHTGDPLISQATFTIADLRVVAAVAASLETTESDAAIVAKNDAVLAQNQASDTWSQYQGESVKKNLYLVAADSGGAKAGDYAKKAKEEADKAG